MVDHLWYCGGAKELDKFLETLRSNFTSNNPLFPRGNPDQVKYAVSFLDTWNNHLDTTQRQTENRDPAKWARNLWEAMDLCLDDFELFLKKLQKMYGDNDRCLNLAMEAMQEYEQLPHKAVRVYANCWKANWRRAGWNRITHEVVLYTMAWAGLRHALKTKFRPWMYRGKDRLDTLDQLFNCAAASVFKLDDKKPGGQQQQSETGESQKDGDKKHNFRPSIFEPVENTSGNSNTSGNYNNSGTSNS